MLKLMTWHLLIEVDDVGFVYFLLMTWHFLIEIDDVGFVYLN